MKILHVSDSYLPTVGGIELPLRDLAADHGEMPDAGDMPICVRRRTDHAVPYVHP